MTTDTEIGITFADLGVAPQLVEALESQGIRSPFPVQALTIEDALAGRDVCGKAKTGSGKTLAFGLPMLMRTPRAAPGAPTSLVLVPTRELAVQVAECSKRSRRPSTGASSPSMAGRTSIASRASSPPAPTSSLPRRAG